MNYKILKLYCTRCKETRTIPTKESRKLKNIIRKLKKESCSVKVIKEADRISTQDQRTGERKPSCEPNSRTLQSLVELQKNIDPESFTNKAGAPQPNQPIATNVFDFHIHPVILPEL